MERSSSTWCLITSASSEPTELDLERSCPVWWQSDRQPHCITVASPYLVQFCTLTCLLSLDRRRSPGRSLRGSFPALKVTTGTRTHACGGGRCEPLLGSEGAGVRAALSVGFGINKNTRAALPLPACQRGHAEQSLQTRSLLVLKKKETDVYACRGEEGI